MPLQTILAPWQVHGILGIIRDQVEVQSAEPTQCIPQHSLHCMRAEELSLVGQNFLLIDPVIV